MFGNKARQFAQAKIVADEGYTNAINSGRVALQHQKYIVEVHPETAPVFRAEVEAWVSWPDRPQVGDVLKVEYALGSTKVNLCIKGDPRFDWELRQAARETEAAATRDELLNGPVSQEPLSSQPDQSDVADHEAELFAKLDALKKARGTHDDP
jgi:hypothetical protein